MEHCNDPMKDTWVNWDEPIQLDNGDPVTFIEKKVSLGGKTYYYVDRGFGPQKHQRNGRPRYGTANCSTLPWVVNVPPKFISLSYIGINN